MSSHSSRWNFSRFQSKKHFFVPLNSAVFKVLICENMKTTLLMFETSFVSTFAQEPKKWTAMRHSQMVNVAKHALHSKAFGPLFTQAWNYCLDTFYFCWVYSSYGINGEGQSGCHILQLTLQARTQTFEKGWRWGGGSVRIKGFLQRRCESLEYFNFEANIRGVNSVSGEKLHDFEIICPAMGVRIPPYPPPPLSHTHTHTHIPHTSLLC